MDKKEVINQAKEVYTGICGSVGRPQEVLAILAIARFLSDEDGNRATDSDKGKEG